MPQTVRHVNGVRTHSSRKVTFFEEHVFSQWLTNVWAAGLTPSEYKVLSAVFARTVAWGKMWEVIPTRHFQNGIPSSQEGVMHFYGTGLSRPTIFKALDTLTREGYILRRALGHTRQYAVNIKVMSTASDPAYAREAARQETMQMVDILRVAQRAAILAAERHYRATLTQEARDTWMALLGPVSGGSNVVKLPVRKRTRCANTHDETPQETQEVLAKTGKKTLPIKKKHKPSVVPSLRSETTEASLDAEHDEVAGEETNSIFPPNNPIPEQPVVSWRNRQRRTRRVVPLDVVNTEVIAFALRHGNENPNPDIPSQALLPVPDPAEDIEAVLRKAGQAIARRRETRLSLQKPKATDIEHAWSVGVASKFAGHHPPAWTPAQRATMTHRIKNIAMPDKLMRWGMVADWVARDFGVATSLAIPFMLRDIDKRENILDALPSLSLFIRFAAEYVAAYAKAFNGRGHTPEEEERARLDSNRHDHFAARFIASRRAGYQNLNTQLMLSDELEELVIRLARNDEEAQAVLEQREGYISMARTLRRAYGAEYRQVLEQRIAQQRVRDARLAQRPDDPDLPPTEDMSGYMEG